MRIVGVSFKPAGKIYYFDPLNLDIKQGDHVLWKPKEVSSTARYLLASPT